MRKKFSPKDEERAISITTGPGPVHRTGTHTCPPHKVMRSGSSAAQGFEHSSHHGFYLENTVTITLSSAGNLEVSSCGQKWRPVRAKAAPVVELSGDERKWILHVCSSLFDDMHCWN